MTNDKNDTKIKEFKPVHQEDRTIRKQEMNQFIQESQKMKPKRRKTLQELTIKDNFMFGAVMSDPENSRLFLELVLGIEIRHVEVIKEKSLIYHPEYRGVRLDIYANDENNTHYNIEMQVEKTDIEKRTRYYHSQIDMELLLSGVDYDYLPESFVIFICDYDPLGYGKYRYTIQNHCLETEFSPFNDGRNIVLLNTKGKNKDEVPAELISFLEYVSMDPEESEEKSQDPFVNRLQKSVRDIKASREMGERYMLFSELLDKERQEGKIEGEKKGELKSIIKTVLRFIQSDWNQEQTASFLNEELSTIKKIYDAAEACAPEYDIDTIYEMIK